MLKFKKQLNFKVKGVDEENNKVEGVFSTKNEDRHRDVVHQNWDLSEYKENPVVVDSHNYRSVTKVVGRVTQISVENDKLQGVVQFAVDENPRAKIAFDLYAGGFVKGFSAGFIAEEFNDKGEIEKAKLFEISTVSIPANAEALAKQKGFSIGDLYKKDEEEVIEDEESEQEEKEQESEEKQEQEENDDKENDNKEEKESEKKDEETEKGFQIEINKPSDRVKLLNKAVNTVEKIGENIKGRNSSNDDRANKKKVNRSINRAVRKLIDNKF